MGKEDFTAETRRRGAGAFILVERATGPSCCFRRWKARLGTPKAITAMAHKLARILWHLIKHRQAYDPKVWALAEEKLRKKKLARLQQNAAALGYQLISPPTS